MINEVKNAIELDIKEHFNIVCPRKYTPCAACGIKFRNEEVKEYSTALIESWKELLENKLYGDQMKHSFPICTPCSTKLKTGNVPKFALCKGFDYLKNIPKSNK